MAEIVIRSSLGEELQKVNYRTRISAEGEEIIFIDDDGVAILKPGLPGPKGEDGAPGVGLPGPDGQPGEDYRAALGVAGGICPLDSEGKVPSANLPPVPSGGASSGGGQIYKVAKVILASGTAVAYNGVVPWNSVKFNDTGFAFANGAFTAPETVPESMLIRLSYSYDFSSATSGKNATIIRTPNGGTSSSTWAGNATRSTVASIEREMVGISSAWFKPLPLEKFEFFLNSNSIGVTRGDASWAQLEVRHV